MEHGNVAITNQIAFANKVLDCLPREEAQFLLSSLKPVHLSSDEFLYSQGDLLGKVYFPLSCVISTVVIMDDGATVEVGMTGREGMVGVAAIFGERTAHNWTRVLIPGDALWLWAEELRDLMHEREIIEKELMGCYRRMITQVSQRVVCSSRHTIMHRLCCWLLMVHDRVGQDDIALTHEAIARQLGARRAGITLAAGQLQAVRAINYSRGHLHINNRHAVEQMACECYLVYKDEFEWFVNCEGAATGDKQLAQRKTPQLNPLARRPFTGGKY